MDSETAHKSAFVTPGGVYQWRKKMPFGLVNSPASFQQLLTKVLAGLTYKMALVYVDDILVFSSSFESHIRDLQQVFDRLITAGLTLKPSKCKFARKQVSYLGHTLSKNGVQVDISKTDAVRSFPIPKTQRQARSFLGLCNYYRKFVHGYSHICAPLNRLLRNDVKFKWDTACNEAFQKLKDALTSPPVLIYPDLNKAFILTTDASNTAIGYILGQRDSRNREHVIAYGGRSLNDAERKLGIPELECLAVLEGIKHFHVYLANNRFQVYTDHRALTWLSNIKQATGRLARWSVLLQGYNFEICYRKGEKNKNADSLSRRDYPAELDNDKEPEDDIPSIDVNEVSVIDKVTPLEVTFLYADSPPVPKASINELSTMDPGDDLISPHLMVDSAPIR